MAKAPSPSLVGVWTLKGSCSGTVCYAAVTISIGGQQKIDPDCSASVYCVTTPNTSGPGIFYGEGVSLTPNGAGNWTWTCAGCRGGQKISIQFKGDTFTGTSTDLGANGEAIGSGPISGTRASGPPSGASLSVGVSVEKSRIQIGDDVGVTVTVTATGGDLTGVSLGGGLLSSSGSASVTRQAAGMSGFGLSSGASRKFAFTVEGAKVGTTDLSVDATATSSSGSTVRGSASAKLTVSGSEALSISVDTTPNPVRLQVEKDGSVTPGEVMVTATVTNRSKTTIDGIQLLSLDPVPKDPTQQLDKLAFPAGTFPVRFAGSFAPGSHASRQLKLKVTGDGAYQFRALALYNDPSQPGGNGRSFSLAGGFRVIAPLLFFTADLHRDQVADTVTTRNGADWVKGGGVWYVGGEIKNLSASQSICVSPLTAQTGGNAVTTGLQDVSMFDSTSSGPPFAGVLKPGQSVPLGMLVVTSSTGATNGTADVQPTGFVADRGATCQLQEDGSMSGAGAQLTPDETDIADGSTSYVVHVDVSADTDATPSAGLLSLIGGFAKGSFTFYAGIARGLAAMAKDFHDDPQFYLDAQSAIFNPFAAQRLLARANNHMMQATVLMLSYARTLPSMSDWNNVTDWVAAVLEKVNDDAYAKIVQIDRQLGQKWFGKLLAAEESGDTGQVWNAWAELAGEGGGALNAVWLQLFVGRIGTLMAADPAAVATAAEDGSSAEAGIQYPEVLSTSKGGLAKAGRVLSLGDLANAWGFPESVVEKLNAIAKKFDVLIGARSRQAISTELESGGAVWKSSNFHQKTVSYIDRILLGMQDVRQGLLAFRSFTPAGEAAAREAILGAGLPEAEQAEALSRLDGRIKENGTDFAHVEELANMERKACTTCPETKGWTNSGFNANESGSAASRTSVTRWRRFELQETPIYDKDGTLLGKLYEPYEENIAYASNPKFGKPIPPLCKAALGTVLCPITGDIDLVYITDVFGGSLTPSKMLEVFSALEDAGFAHTDLVTWIEQQTKAFYFPGKAKQLAGVATGEEGVAQFAPDGTNRTTYVGPITGTGVPVRDPATGLLSVPVGPNAYQLTIIGGYNPAMR